MGVCNVTAAPSPNGEHAGSRFPSPGPVMGNRRSKAHPWPSLSPHQAAMGNFPFL